MFHEDWLGVGSASQFTINGTVQITQCIRGKNGNERAHKMHNNNVQNDRKSISACIIHSNRNYNHNGDSCACHIINRTTCTTHNHTHTHNHSNCPSQVDCSSSHRCRRSPQRRHNWSCSAGLSVVIGPNCLPISGPHELASAGKTAGR